MTVGGPLSNVGEKRLTQQEKALLKPEILDLTRPDSSSTTHTELKATHTLINVSYPHDPDVQKLKDAVKRLDQTSPIAKDWLISLAKCSVDAEE
jgi:hypothetical protein